MGMESGIQTSESKRRNPESTVWNPESTTRLDSLTWGDFLSCSILQCLNETENFSSSRLIFNGSELYLKPCRYPCICLLQKQIREMHYTLKFYCQVILKFWYWPFSGSVDEFSFMLRVVSSLACQGKASEKDTRGSAKITYRVEM